MSNARSQRVQPIEEHGGNTAGVVGDSTNASRQRSRPLLTTHSDTGPIKHYAEDTIRNVWRQVVKSVALILEREILDIQRANSAFDRLGLPKGLKFPTKLGLQVRRALIDAHRQIHSRCENAVLQSIELGFQAISTINDLAGVEPQSRDYLLTRIVDRWPFPEGLDRAQVRTYEPGTIAKDLRVDFAVVRPSSSDPSINTGYALLLFEGQSPHTLIAIPELEKCRCVIFDVSSPPAKKLPSDIKAAHGKNQWTITTENFSTNLVFDFHRNELASLTHVPAGIVDAREGKVLVDPLDPKKTKRRYTRRKDWAAPDQPFDAEANRLKVQFKLRMSEDLIEQVKLRAQTEGVHQQDWVIQAIIEKLKLEQ